MSKWVKCDPFVSGVDAFASVTILCLFFLVTLYGVFTNHSCLGVSTRCLLLELLDVSVSELLVQRSSAAQPGR